MIKRMISSTPFAILVTAGLGIGMVKMIAVEFQAMPKTEITKFEINPVKKDIPPPVREHKLEKRKVIIPPAAPVIERAEAQLPIEEFTPMDGTIHEMKPIKLDKIDFQLAVADTHARPIFRVGGTVPPRATKSGHCKMRFAVSAEGSPFNIEAVYCTERLFERNSIKATQKFKYTPKILNGRAVAMQGVETTIRYQLLDEQGRLIPE